jgi:hypothetical protein
MLALVARRIGCLTQTRSARQSALFAQLLTAQGGVLPAIRGMTLPMDLASFLHRIMLTPQTTDAEIRTGIIRFAWLAPRIGCSIRMVFALQSVINVKIVTPMEIV